MEVLKIYAIYSIIYVELAKKKKYNYAINIRISAKN